MDVAVESDDRQANFAAPVDGPAGAEEAWSRRQTAVLLRVASALNEVGSLDTLMPTIAEAAADAIGVDHSSVYAYDETRTSTVASGLYGRHQITAGNSFVEELAPADVPAEVEVIRTGRTLYRTRDTAFPNPIPVEDWYADLVVPLVADGRTQGVLNVGQSGVERVFTLGRGRPARGDREPGGVGDSPGARGGSGAAAGRSLGTAQPHRTGASRRRSISRRSV